MRRCWTIAALFLSFTLTGASAWAGGLEWSISRGTRSHLRITTETGQVFLLSSLQRSRGKNLRLDRAEVNSTLLIETSTGARYVVTMETQSDLAWNHISSTMRLQALGTQDSLSVSYSTSLGEGSGTFRVASPSCQETLEESKVSASYPSGIHPALASLSQASREVLGLLRALEAQRVLFVTVTPNWMAPVFGTKPTEKPLSLKVEVLPPDCTYDAAFGFPCSDNEKAAKNGKVRFFPLDP